MTCFMIAAILKIQQKHFSFQFMIDPLNSGSDLEKEAYQGLIA